MILFEAFRKKRRLMLEKLTNTVFAERLFEESMLSGESVNVAQMIKAGEWENVTPKQFAASIYGKSKHKEMLTEYTEDELKKMKLFKLKGYDIGFALKKLNGEGTKHNEIVSVYNNEPNVKGIGVVLTQAAVDNGGCYLDHFDTPKLRDVYTKAGFKEYDRSEYDPQYDPDGSFKEKYGEVAVVYRYHNTCKIPN